MRAILIVYLIAMSGFLAVRTRADADTDGDGRTDSQEAADGTDPNNEHSVRWVSLAAWRFANANLLDEAGQPPLSATNIVIVPGIDGNGGSISSSNNPVLLNYRSVEADGSANLAPKRGSIWFHIRPHWFSVSVPPVFNMPLFDPRVP